MRPQMRLFLMIAAFVSILGLAASAIEAQPGGKKDKGGKGTSETVDEFVAKLMAFNKTKDGKLTKAELTDPRLLALFERADTNKDGVVTRAELEALFQREKLEGGGFGPGGGDKGKGGKDGFGDKKGFKGKGPPQPGVILSPFFQDALNLTDAQRKQLADLQKDVDAKLDKILTAEQKTHLKEMSTQKGFGPPGGDKKGPPPGEKK
jgi:EF hand